LGDELYKREIASQTQRGFIYTNEIAELIVSKYSTSASQYPTFDGFMPEILAILAEKQSPFDVKK
jgi:hypothetical protein